MHMIMHVIVQEYIYIDIRWRILYKKGYLFILHRLVDGMQEADKIEDSIDIKRPIVIRALRRSNIRRKVAEYLFDISPSFSYTSEIAYNVGATSPNVIGALRGMNSRYKKDESLIGLNVVEEKSSSRNIRLYGITPFGKEMIESVKNSRL